jgi:site-specific recombinase XerC
MKLRILPKLGGARLSNILRIDVQELADEMLGEGLNPSTIRNTLMPLRAVFRRALKRSEVAISPLTELELPAVRGRREWTRPAEDALLLVAAAPEQDPHCGPARSIAV